MATIYVYILKCSDNSYYIGHSDNLEKRLGEHEQGLSSYTRNKLPITLVYVESVDTRSAALEFEHQIKKWSRKKKEALISKNWDALQFFAKKKFNKNRTE